MLYMQQRILYKRNRNAKAISFKKVLALIHAQTGHRHRPFYPLESCVEGDKSYGSILVEGTWILALHCTWQNRHATRRQKAEKDPSRPLQVFQSCLALADLPSPQECLVRWSLVSSSSSSPTAGSLYYKTSEGDHFPWCTPAATEYDDENAVGVLIFLGLIEAEIPCH